MHNTAPRLSCPFEDPQAITSRPVHQISLLRQSRDIALQYQILVLLGLHGQLTLLEIGSHIYHEMPEDELPLATLELAVLALRLDRLVRTVWFRSPRRYCLAYRGRIAHRYLVDRHQADLLP